MRTFVYFCALALGLSGLLLATGCASTAKLPANQSQLTAADTIAGYGLIGATRKLVIRGNVIVQQGQGNSVVGKDKTGQHSAGVSTGANSPVTASTKHSGPAWWVYLLVGAVSIIAWEWLSHRALNFSWLPTRRPAPVP